MYQKNELLISGIRLSLEDVEELQALVPAEETEVAQMETKSTFNDLVQVIFNDFTPIALVRDYILSEAMTRAYDYIKPVIQQLIRKGIEVENICIEKDMISEKGIDFRLNVATRTHQYEVIIKALETTSIEQLTPHTQGNTIIVRLDENGKIEITIM